MAAPRNKSASVNKCRTSINPQSNSAEVRNVGTVYQAIEEASEHRPSHHRSLALLRLLCDLVVLSQNAVISSFSVLSPTWGAPTASTA
jgi:hypothetical protein